jgi:hypothetical protein
MTSVKPALFCPSCQFELPGPVNDCPKCGKVLRAATNEFFEVPYYLASQMKDYAAEVENRLSSSKPLSPAETERFDRIKKEYELWAREVPAEEKIAALVDAQLVLRHVIHSKIDPEHLEEIIGRGIAIGKLAETMKAYFKCGGSLREPETRFVPADTGDYGRSATSTPRSGDSF